MSTAREKRRKCGILQAKTNQWVTECKMTVTIGYQWHGLSGLVSLAPQPRAQVDTFFT